MSEIESSDKNSWLNILFNTGRSHRRRYNNAKALEYVQQNFMEFYPDDSFLQLDHETFYNILESDYLNVENEEVVFDSVRRWITFNHLDPETYLKPILKVVRFSLLPIKYLLEEVKPFVNQILNGREEFFDELQHHVLDEYNLKKSVRKYQKLYLIKSVKLPNCDKKLLSISSNDLNTAKVAEKLQKTCILEVYNGKRKRWTRLNDLKINKINYCVANVGENILIIGGSSGVKHRLLNTVESLNLRTGIVSQIAPLNEKRQNSTAVVVKQGKFPFVYVFGGMTNEKLLKSVERWDSLSRIWTVVTPMTVARTGHGAVLLKDEIYVVGGRIGNAFDKTVEAYDFENDRWIPKASMNNPKAHFGITAFKNCIYVAGGNIDSGAPVNTVERYDPTLNVWTTIANISSNGVVGISGLENKLICAGGAPSNIVEKYDEENNQWRKLRSSNKQHTDFLIELEPGIEVYSRDWLIQNRSSNKLIFLGGVSLETSNTFETFNAVENKWSGIKDFPLFKLGCTINIIDNKLLIIGGSSRHKFYNTVNSIDLSTGIVKSLPIIYEELQSIASVVVQEKNEEYLYILGGEEKYDKHSASVQKWNPKTEKWTKCTPMTSGRFGHGVVFLNGKIYVFGGRRRSYEYLETVEAYDISNETWESKASMRSPRGFFGIAIFKDQVYVAGGESSNNTYINMVERYNPIEDSWSILANIQSSLRVGLCAVGNRLICAGGYQNSVEEYDVLKNEWVSLPPMTKERSGFLLDLPWNAKLYI